MLINGLAWRENFVHDVGVDKRIAINFLTSTGEKVLKNELIGFIQS